MAIHEDEYFRLRDEQLAQSLGRERGLSRRELVKLGAAGALALAARPGAAHRHAPARRPRRRRSSSRCRRSCSRRSAPTPRCGGRRCAARATHARRPVLRPQPHGHAAHRRARPGALRGLRQRAARRGPVELPLRRPAAGCRPHRHRVRRVRGQRPQLLRRASRARPATGTAWTLGAIGVARWRGVRLRRRAASARDHAGDAVDVLPAGLDATVVSDGVDQGHVRRPLPVAKALDDVLLAYEMNGEPLPPDHGFPGAARRARAGSASRTSSGSATSRCRPAAVLPVEHDAVPDVRRRLPAGRAAAHRQPVKSAFELPCGATVPAGRRRLLHRPVVVGRRADPFASRSAPTAAATWRRRARLHDRPGARRWVRWSADGRRARPGAGTRCSRGRPTATARTQPDTRPFNTHGYLFDAVVRHPVTVAAG